MCLIVLAISQAFLGYEALAEVAFHARGSMVRDGSTTVLATTVGPRSLTLQFRKKCCDAKDFCLVPQPNSCTAAKVHIRAIRVIQYIGCGIPIERWRDCLRTGGAYRWVNQRDHFCHGGRRKVALGNFEVLPFAWRSANCLNAKRTSTPIDAARGTAIKRPTTEQIPEGKQSKDKPDWVQMHLASDQIGCEDIVCQRLADEEDADNDQNRRPGWPKLRNCDAHRQQQPRERAR